MSKLASKLLALKSNYLFASLFALVWLIYSLPTILFSQWFPMDLGQIFEMGQNFQDWYEWVMSPYNGSGRYFPVYWGYYSLQAYIFGTHVAPFFIVQCLVFGLTAILSSWLFYQVTLDKGLSFILLVTFFFSTAIPENLNSIGKAEPLASFFIFFILAIFYKKNYQNLKTILSKESALYGLIIGFIFSLSIWTKETSMVLFGFGFFCLLSASIIWRFDGTKMDRDWYKKYLGLLLALSFGFIISRAPYLLFEKKTTKADYTEYAITPSLILENFNFYLIQQPDIFYFGVSSIIFLLLIGKRFLFQKKSLNDFDISGYVFVMGMAAMGWAYYLALLIWRWPMAYYMLLPSLLFKFAFLYGAFILSNRFEINKVIKYFFLSVTILVFIYTVAQGYYISESHIAYSRMYTEAMLKSEHYINQSGPKHSLIIESYPFYAEQTGLQYDKGEGWKRVSGIKGIADVLDPEVSNNKELMKLLHVTQEQLDQNFNNVPKSGDYLLVFTGNKLATWFSRGVTPYFLEDSILKQQGSYEMELVSENSIEASAVYFHTWSNKLVWSKTFTGYKLYHVLSNGPKFLWKGRYPDGWIGKKSSLQVNESYGIPISLKVSAPDFSLPNSVKIFRDKQFFKEIKFSNRDEQTVKITDQPAGNTLLEFEVDKVVVPLSIGLGKDARALGARIELDKAR